MKTEDQRGSRNVGKGGENVKQERNGSCSDKINPHFELAGKGCSFMNSDTEDKEEGKKK